MALNYPQEQMHRIAYSRLDERQIEGKLRAAQSGPSSASPLSDALAGSSLRVVTDYGPRLSYRFSSDRELAVAENDGDSMDVGYGALMLDHVVMFSHMVPGTQRGYHVVLDRDTGLATVFEVWFSGFDDKREVQRQVWFGYVDEPGTPAPQARHVSTNRIEGKGFYWRQDNGIETLEFFPSTFYSNFVELTRLGGELGFCAPSDYIQVTDELYVYQRTECEFSGISTLYVLDVNRIEQVGVRLGFNETDDLEYYMFKGTGEWLGQIAQFEPFGQISGAIANEPPQEKGARRVYRPMRNDWTLTKSQTEAAIAQSRNAFAERSGMAGNALPPSEALVDRPFTLRLDGRAGIEYRFDSIDSLRWREEGQRSWNEERYEAWEPAPGVVMFGHFLTGAPQHDKYTVVVDLDNALATVIHGTVGTPYIANETAAQTVFGVLEAEDLVPPKYRRHDFTDELVGRAVTYNYSPGLTSMHLYTTPHSLSWIIFGQDGAGGMEWSGPAAYVKIRDQLYLAYWLEEACNGTLGTIVINLRTMHDCGTGYHCGADGLRLSAMGAHARHAGRFDSARFFGPRG
ncbi:MAG: MoaF N-terminal domain-containing protein [Gammaproteobacteria bacterium]|jgi:hypothetical protein